MAPTVNVILQWQDTYQTTGLKVKSIIMQFETLFTPEGRANSWNL